MMIDEKLESSITNLEIASKKIDSLLQKVELKEDEKILIKEWMTLIRLTLDELRDYEIQKEIDNYSNLDE